MSILNNYIDLQKLRTATTPDVVIETNIAEQHELLKIAPMLLIPFVENAFKHGISLRESSFVRVSLQTNRSVLYFDVYNSIHRKADDDPEKTKSGIGLQNVKQRLAMIYPQKHELVIRENAKEFYVHLTIRL
ncbi:MAG: GHKL domain-containing protein [Niabella sp.]